MDWSTRLREGWRALGGGSEAQRRFVRVEPRPGERVEVQIMGSDFLESFTAKDISLGGVGIFAPHGFEGYDVSHELELIIKLPRMKPFVAKGNLRHKSGDKRRVYGIAFVELSPTATRALSEYIASVERR